MLSFEEMILEQIRHNEELINKIERKEPLLPEGRLEIDQSKSIPRFFQITTDPITKKKKKVYLSLEEMEIIFSLADKPYLVKVRRVAEKNLHELMRLKRNYHEEDIQNIFLQLPEARQKLVEPIEMTMEQWLKTPYNGLPFRDRDPYFLTQKGERVRSKAEKILADMFWALGIAYKYECPLFLGSGQTYYPDFSFFNPFTQEFIYWEHFGMMDNPEYASHAMKKIETYETHGIYRGHNLIVTFESSSHPLNVSWARNLAEKFLLPFNR